MTTTTSIVWTLATIAHDRLEHGPCRRSVLDARGLELQASIAEHGQLQPALVHPTATADYFEIISGNRRAAATKQLGLPLRCFVASRQLSREEVLAIGLAENEQRSDLHAIDRACQYLALQKDANLTAAGIAARCGTTETAVQEHLRLLALTPRVQQMIRQGALTADCALEVGRIDAPAQQERAAALMQQGRGNNPTDPHTRASARAIVVEQFLRRLADAPFDPTLTYASKKGPRPPCAGCIHRSGNQGQLFADLPAGDDRCLLDTCWNAKGAAHWNIVKRECVKAGGTILSEDDAKEYLIGATGGLTRQGRKAWVDADELTGKLGKGDASWKTVLGEHAPPPAMCRLPSGAIVTLYPADAAKKLLGEHHADKIAAAKSEPKTKQEATSQLDDDQIRAAKIRKAHRAARDEAFREIVIPTDATGCTEPAFVFFILAQTPDASLQRSANARALDVTALRQSASKDVALAMKLLFEAALFSSWRDHDPPGDFADGLALLHGDYKTLLELKLQKAGIGASPAGKAKGKRRAS